MKDSCVKSCVRVTKRGAEGEEEEDEEEEEEADDGIQNQKQEPHTKMWVMIGSSHEPETIHLRTMKSFNQQLAMVQQASSAVT